MYDIHNKQVLNHAIARAGSHAPFLAGLLEREPELAGAMAAGHWSLPRFGMVTDEPVATRLRRERRQVALTLAIGDLAGIVDLETLTRALTGFADHALHSAITAALRERTPGEEPRGFAAIALGKQGSFELNYSSDIDPIFLFDPATLPRRGREEPQEAAVRIGRRVVEILQARDRDGYVLRVDLRLRPSPEVSPIVIPVHAAIGYYESAALPWERAAFIRARAAAGDIALGERFLEAVAPFIWRRSLDYGAIAEVMTLSRRIREHHVRGQQFGPGYDLKRGRGGIREVEFFAQAHQLIHGGRDPALRAPATKDALMALAEAERIDGADAVALADAYTLLRTLEHRVQMVDDRQTHTLPEGASLDGVAALHGLADGDQLLAGLAPHIAATARIYDSLGGDTRPAMSRDDAVLASELTAMGFADGEAAAMRVETWRGGAYRALRSVAAREALEAALPTLLPALAAAADPAAALVRLDRLLESLPSAINLFRLLEAQPALASLLTTVLAHAPPLAEMLGDSPMLLDGLIDASAFADMAGVAALTADMEGGRGRDYGARLDHVRHVVGEKRFALGTQIVAAASDPLAVAAGYARVAEAAVVALAGAAVAEFAGVHGEVPGSELVILALGRLGGGALTHASDLDIVYLFTGDFRATSDGAKPLGATLYFNRLASRVGAALSVRSAAGPLYDIDTRLRPSGAQGPLAVSLDSFTRYQQEQAWTWEHMALTRARPIFGSNAARGEAAGVVRAALMGAADSRDIAAEAATMRGEIARHKPPGGVLDVKLLPGGLVDLEFAVHVLQLVHRTALSPNLGDAIGELVAGGHLPRTIADAHDLLTGVLVTARLLAPDLDPPAPATRAMIAQALGIADWLALLARIDDARQEVAAVWKEVSAGDR